MLNNYLAQTQRLCHDVKQDMLDIGDLVPYVNMARGQIAGETECCRVLGTLSTVVGARNYDFSSINIGSANGLSGVVNARQMLYSVASGYQWIRPRPWSWFWLFKMNNPVPDSGPPAVWSQFSQGGSGQGSITGIGPGTMISGSFYIDPPPDLVYSLLIDCTCYPAALVVDTDVEAIPYLFSDAVPYFAAYLAFLSERKMDIAGEMFKLYKTFVDRANQASAPTVNRFIYERQTDPTTLNKLGVTSSMGQ